MKEIPLINTCWLKPFADYFAERGVSMAPYCEIAKIELRQVTSGEGWITKHQLYVFLEALAKGENMPEVGFVVGEFLTPDCLGDLGKAMATADTLGGVIRIFCELINRHVEGNHCRLDEGGNGEVWFFNTKSHSTDPGRAIADHAGLMSMINLVRLVAGRDWYPPKVHLQTPATSDYQMVAGLMHCDIRFDQTAAGFAFPGHWLLNSTKQAIHLPPGKETSTGLIREGEPIAAKIELLLQEMIGVGGMCPTIKLMADLCDTSVRTLHRQLKNTGSSYQHILDRVRLEKAFENLLNFDISIKELAYSLGYSGPNNFIRAFRRLTSMSPAQYRESHAQSAPH